MNSQYDVIIVGAGHAGCEAAHAASRMKAKVLLVTMNMATIGQMSCNPAMGGVAKGQIIREIDALGGMSGFITDKTTIQFRMLNKSKGPAMWSPRAQVDRHEFSLQWRYELEKQQNIDFRQETVECLILSGSCVVGVKTTSNESIYGGSVILTNGTFLNGKIHIGQYKSRGGRISEPFSKGITEQLIKLGFTSGRMKTGTPPRLDGRTINYNMMIEQKGDEDPCKFSFRSTTNRYEQRSCWITHTNEKVHQILTSGFDNSPLYNGDINSTGPRYCPSIEDKIKRFSDKKSHQLFIEPEGKKTVEIYLNGFSSSLPAPLQLKALKQVKGLEHVKIFRPGYAIEYDYFQPTQLKNTLETKGIGHLYFAGQINGTTGYEEAACQGLLAGVNAVAKIKGHNQLVLSRKEAYIGILVDDLVTKGTDEPYRMFTSRAEYRLTLRHDNADIRLTKRGFDLGIISKKQHQLVMDKLNQIEEIKKIVKKLKVKPGQINGYLKRIGSSVILENTYMVDLMKRPNFNILDTEEALKSLKHYTKEAIEQVDISIKYHIYIEREQQLTKKLESLDNYKICKDFNYKELKSISTEAIEKLSNIRPDTIGQASRISGVSRSDIAILAMTVKQ